MTQQRITVTPTEKKIAETLDALSDLIKDKNFNQKIFLGAYFYFVISEMFLNDKKFPDVFKDVKQFFLLSEEEEAYFDKILSEAMAKPGDEELISH